MALLEEPPIIAKPLAIVVMGVSGSGKSTVGWQLAQALGCSFLEGDDFHPEKNVAKMAAGVPLDDDDRRPWLQRLGEALGGTARNTQLAVATCSALKREYRDCLRTATRCPTVFIHLQASENELAQRLATRQRHYMPISLLESQLATLEPPEDDEWARTFLIEPDSAKLVAMIVAWLNDDHQFRLDAAKA